MRSQRLGKALVHGAWQSLWWGGDATWTELLGSAPRFRALDAAADRIQPGDAWTCSLHPRCRHQHPPSDALIVLAGQQPVLGGGAALVAHKAATAISLATVLSDRWKRPVLPVFLLATQDHDSSEIDHLDFIDNSNSILNRIRCPIRPKSEMFSRARWDIHGFDLFKRFLERETNNLSGCLEGYCPDSSIADHVALLLDRTFGALGLHLVEAHRLPRVPATAILRRALQDSPALAEVLARGARALDLVDRAAPFDPADPRPLVLESRNGRRRRLEPSDEGAALRLTEEPAAFSPHAALRPVVQAASMPVVAQVCGPSEIVYLGQARGLHDLFGEQAPLLVPRMEATHLRLPGELAESSSEKLLELLDLEHSQRLAQHSERALLSAAHEFTRALRREDPGLTPRLQHFEESLARSTRRLAEAPLWRGRRQLGPAQAIHPRGRYQDTTLSWLPQAWSDGDPEAWARHIVSLAEPTAEPAHVVHAYPEDLCHG